MFVERVHLRTSERRGGSRRTIFAIGPEASASLRAHPVASSTQRSASDHEVPSRIFANRSRTMMPSAFSSRTSPDHGAAATGFTSAPFRPAWAFAHVARIPGASRGLGYAVAEFLARQRWTLILAAGHEKPLGAAAERLRAAGAVVTAVPGDVARPSDRRAIAAAARRAGRLDLLVNNASELGPSPLPPLLEHPLPALRRGV